ncbi:MAG TPA: helix-hairpin-helix domain-containing protein, partial [Ignavibacteriales bacterium]|nr:helix-hairpin-helix domain-containing protein [Ignavibacteriales bacterium]
MDPLAELVKIDPKSIGVGLYQHDVDQKLLSKKLDDVVVSCVNYVGVDLNTASVSLLTYVSGLNKRIASNIVKYRESTGKFTSRQQLMNVTGLGDKAFEQAAG